MARAPRRHLFPELIALCSIVCLTGATLTQGSTFSLLTTRQIADVLTESFFAREQRDRQIAAFNVMDQTTFTCSHLRSLLMQLDESISKRQPQHEEEARSAETSRPVRNPYAVKPHSASSSSRSGVHTQFVPVGRNPEPMATQLNCDAETSRDSVFDDKSVW